jgi:hypothetical protein
MQSISSRKLRVHLLLLKLHYIIDLYLATLNEPVDYIIIIIYGNAAQHGLWPPRSRGFMITHNDAPQAVGLLWTSDQLVAETSDNTRFLYNLLVIKGLLIHNQANFKVVIIYVLISKLFLRI